MSVFIFMSVLNFVGFCVLKMTNYDFCTRTQPSSHLFLYEIHFFIRVSIFLTLSEIEAEIFLTFIGVNWLKEVAIICHKKFDFC